MIHSYAACFFKIEPLKFIVLLIAELASMASRLLVIVEQWDKAAENADSLKAAGEEFSRLVEQVNEI